jgi:predicted flap endonuclease-1-like 5' DNA nuclease
VTQLACVLWWLVPGVFLGWLLSWLFDLLFRRNGRSLIDTAKAEAAAVQARANGLESELTVSRNQLSNYANEAARLRSELSAARTAHDDAKSSLGLARLELDMRNASLANYATDFSSLQTQFSTARQSYAQLESALTSARAELEAAKTAAASTHTTVTATDAGGDELVRLKSELAAALSAKDSLRQSLGMIETERSNATTALAAANAKIKRFMAEQAAATQRTDEAQAELQRELTATKSAHSSALTSLEAAQKDGAAAQKDTEPAERAGASFGGETQRTTHQNAEQRILMTRYGFIPRHRDRDDLTLVEGIGPKIEDVLLAAGIDTHAKLAATPVEELRRVLDAAGPQFNRANPGTWPRQAMLAVNGDWAGLRRWQDELIAGVEVPKAGV